MVTVDSSYALGQLERALVASEKHGDPAVRERARVRVEQWRRVLDGMASGALEIGSRTPTAAPAWATLEVVHGGFATGALAAGGPLLPHESALAELLGAPAEGRRAIALHYLSDRGRAELEAMLADGMYRVSVPEEGAFLALAALLARGATEGAASILDAIAPYLGELRFQPQPSSRAPSAVSTVHAATVGEVRARVANMKTPPAVLRMTEALAIWAPMTDRAVDLFLETVVDDVPCRALPEGWRERAARLVAQYGAARVAHPLCQKPHRRKQNLAILVDALARLAEPSGALSDRETGWVRVALAGHVRKHGAPGSELRRAHRAEQARVASLATRGESARVLAARMARLPPDASLESVDALAAPLSKGAHAGAPLWPSVAAKLDRCLEASVEELVERGVLSSGEAIARVLPQISAHVRAMGFADPEIARLYAAIDAAFRRRRSLLLLEYQHQVRLEELPWAAALEPLRTDDGTSIDSARRLFQSVTALALGAFPQAIVPNPLLVELTALAKRAHIELPIVEELAADIFMGSFTAKFVRSAALCSRRLEGTVYARYYAVPTAEVLAMAASLDAAPTLVGRVRQAMGLGAPKTGASVPAFGRLCERMAGIDPHGRASVGHNGRVIEQQQILTTQNLVPLIDAAALAPEQMPDLAWRSFAWVVRRAQVVAPRRIHRLRTAKNAAYAWRQAIAYLSLAPLGATEAFLTRARAHLAAQPEPFRSRFDPILGGLETAHAGGVPAVRLLGWATGAHPLVVE